ncbi:hypothetical protein LPB72_09455 [Hydrogenophaga crassostreae]|uniref:Uncharacterized protein n=1 Tax=Hydrogenophaga crassostreae TaxID=1763535 RepID=A0A167I5Q0_9BURK|nr:ankyrin repeat domain-containing protein [Hydrogenophaga crassostreae]AOW14097.1 hypothetical protein LPB072_15875 [Hydrogenophaga crassostreae]OAD42182.1 hypothetical protein LPB72_09455 [Hydrogenophaga crassostreae]
MNTPPPHSRDPHPNDPLLQRYEEANAHDASRPGATLREAVLAHATSQVTAPAPPGETQRPAANDSLWTWRALGSIAVVGLAGLLVMQFERGTPDEQHAALGTSSQQTDRSVAAARSNTAPPVEAGASEASESAAPGKASGAVPISPPEPTPVTPPVNAEADAERPASLARPASPERAARIEAPDALEPAEMPDAMAPAAGAAPPMGAESVARAAPMASTRPAAPSRGTLNESQQRAKRGVTTGNQVIDPAGLSSDSVQTALPPLHAAAIKGDLEGAQRLMAEGVNINALDSRARTALMLAAMGGQKNLVVALMDAGADATLRDHAGLSAADHALRAGHADWLPLMQPRR